MSASPSAREEILSRIRAAVPADRSDEPENITRTYQRIGSLRRETCLDLLLDRLADYESEILHVAEESGLPAAIAQALNNAHEHSVLVDPSFPAAWLPQGFDIVPDNNLSIHAMNGIPAVVTTCEAASASTGTIYLVHGGPQGRRAITLLPDHHICLLNRSHVYELVPEALAAIASHSSEPITTISGPSATSDIEMTRIRGVHGPRHLTVILYGRI
ncbi:MAG TPA: LUD domain-containing protein [Acidobacteriaceae bacterium]